MTRWRVPPVSTPAAHCSSITPTPRWSVGSTTVRGTSRLGPCVTFATSRRQHVPRGAELVERLARDLSALLVRCVVVERVTAVGHLGRPVATLGRAEQCRRRAGARLRRALRQVWRPEAGAGAVADARRSLVDHEVVEGTALG